MIPPIRCADCDDSRQESVDVEKAKDGFESEEIDDQVKQISMSWKTSQSSVDEVDRISRKDFGLFDMKELREE